MKNSKTIIDLLMIVLFLLSNSNIIASEMDNNPEKPKKQDLEFEKYKAFGFNLFTGYGLLNDNISKYFTNPVYIGINCSFIKQRIELQIDDYFGFGKIKKEINSEWSENRFVIHVMLGGNLGYTFINIEKFKLVPVAGVGLNVINLIGGGDDANSPLLPYYKIGCYIDIKALRLFKNNQNFNYNDAYTCIRLSFGINSPIVTPKEPNYYKGGMVYLTVGIAGFTR